MSTILFLISFVITVFLSIFGWTKILQIGRSSMRQQKDILVSALWIVCYAAAGIILWFFVSGAFWGFACGILIGLSAVATTMLPKKTEEEKEDQSGQ